MPEFIPGLRAQAASECGPWPELIDELSSALSGVPANQVILQSLPTGPLYAALTAATWTSGLVGATIGLRATSREIRIALETIRPAVVVHDAADRRFADIGLREDLRTFGPSTLRIADIATPRTLSEGDAWLGATSGSTGTPKYAILTHANIEHNASETAKMQGLNSADVCCIFTPSAFTYALNQMVSAVAAGSKLSFWADGMSSPADLLAHLQDTGTTRISANPTSFALLLNRALAAKNDTLVSIVSGGQPLTSAMVEKLQEWAPSAHIFSGYGITECVNRVTYMQINMGQHINEPVAPVGTPIGQTSVTLMHDATSRPGEIVLESPSLMRGYLTNATENIEVQAGPFHTGDLGTIDAKGVLRIVGRLKTQINVGNEMISPEEIEGVTLQLPDVAACGVTAVSDTLTGEAICAIVAFDGASGTSSVKPRMHQLHQLWSLNFSRVKRPKHVFEVASSDIPTTEYGKVDRGRLAILASDLMKQANIRE